MTATTLVPYLTLVGLLAACSGKDAETPTGSAGSSGTTEETGSGGDGAPLSNGPGGSLLMSASCAPDDGEAWYLAIGLGSDCSIEEADPDLPYVLLTVYHPDLLANPVGTEVSWTDWTGGSAQFAPEGVRGAAYPASAGSLYLSEWEGADTGRPEGGAVAGWYVLGLDDGSELGASFTGTWCGGEPLCG